MTIRLSLLFLLAPALAHAAGGTVVSAVVYPDRAQVTRERSTSCGARAPAVFDQIPPSADPASFRAVARGGSVEGLRFEEQIQEAFGAEFKAAEAALKKLESELGALQDARRRNQAAGDLAAGYHTLARTLIGREMSDPRPDVGRWTGALQAAQKAQLDASAKISATDLELRTMETKLVEARARLGALAAAGQRTSYVVEVIAACSGTAHVQLTYLVGGASWSPAYEARLGENNAVELSTFGTITQATGEDWKNARLTLSTAVPRQNATPPEIGKLQVWADEREPPRKALVSRSELQEHARASGAAGPGGARLGVADQGVSVQMTLPEPADVAGDGTPARLLVARTRMNATVRYRTAPKFMPFVFRVAELTNSAPFPLLSGPVDAFRRGHFLGRYGTERIATGDRFTLTFGVEESMKVKRKVVAEVQRVEGLFGGKRHHRYEYKLEVANYLGTAQELELTEQVPVSELDDVQVVIDPRTTAGYGQRRDDGLLTWTLKLAPGQKRDLNLVFRIEAPSSYDQ
jgi:uncharacterized protein (TIGR02231 family)